MPTLNRLLILKLFGKCSDVVDSVRVLDWGVTGENY